MTIAMAVQPRVWIFGIHAGGDLTFSETTSLGTEAMNNVILTEKMEAIVSSFVLN